MYVYVSIDTYEKQANFPDGPVAKTLHSQCREPRFNPWSGTRSHKPQPRPGTIKYINIENQGSKCHRRS